MTPDFTYDQINRGMVEHPARMTPARQPQGYTITEEDYVRIYSIDCFLTSEERRRICERAARTSPPAQQRIDAAIDKLNLAQHIIHERVMEDNRDCIDLLIDAEGNVVEAIALLRAGEP